MTAVYGLAALLGLTLTVAVFLLIEAMVDSAKGRPFPPPASHALDVILLLVAAGYVGSVLVLLLLLP